MARMGAPRRRRGLRGVVPVVIAGSLVAAVIVGLVARPLSAWLVTRRALADAEPPRSGKPYRLEDVTDTIASRYGGWFRRGFIDRRLLAGQLEPGGLVPANYAPAVVITSYLKSVFDRPGPRTAELEELALEEFSRWLDPVLVRPVACESLVELLTGDYVMGEPDVEAGLPKQLLASLLFGRDPRLPEISDVIDTDGEYGRWKEAVLELVRTRHWNALLHHLEHRREKVRAGALLLVFHHPDRKLFAERARDMLGDPSQLVRLAAAGTLALEGRRDGWGELVVGLFHREWEIRFWSGLCLALVDQSEVARSVAPEDLWRRAPSWARLLDYLPVHIARYLEPDDWVQRRYREMIRQGLEVEQLALRRFLDRSGRRKTMESLADFASVLVAGHRGSVARLVGRACDLARGAGASRRPGLWSWPRRLLESLTRTHPDDAAGTGDE